MSNATQRKRQTRILQTDPVREAFAGLSSRSNYYDTKGAARREYDAILEIFGYHFDHNSWADFYGDSDRRTIEVLNDECDVVGHAVLSWYRMPSGRWEFTGYLA